MVDIIDVEMALAFCVRMAEDAKHVPPQPWTVEGVMLTATNGDRIARTDNPVHGAHIAGMMTGATHINRTFHELAILLIEAGKDGWESPAGRQLKLIIGKLMLMERDGRLPKIADLEPTPKL